MDRKSIIVLIVCGLLFVFWAQYLMPRYAHTPQRTNQVLTSSSSNRSAPEISAAVTNPPVAPAAAAQATPNVPEEFLVDENDKARYTFTSYGGTLKLVELKDYPEVISCRDKNDVVHSCHVQRCICSSSAACVRSNCSGVTVM